MHVVDRRLTKAYRDARRAGIADAIARLEREAYRYANTNVHHADAMTKAAEVLRKMR